MANAVAPVIGDANGDSAVDGADLLQWQLQLVGDAPAANSADANRNGIVNGADLELITANYGAQTAMAVAAESAGSSTVAADAIFAGGDFVSLFTEAGATHRLFRPARRGR